jgi:hypothetical protein
MDERTGVLVLSLHRPADDGPLVATLTAIDALDAERATLVIPGDLDAVLDRIRDWYGAVDSGTPLDWVTSR